MSAQDIQNWISVARSSENDFDEAVPTVLSGSPWEDFMELALVNLTSSSLKKRVSFLNEKILSVSQHGELDSQRAPNIFDLLVITYPRYIDAASRNAVLAVLSSLVRRDAALAGNSSSSVTGILDCVVRWLDSETMRLCSQTFLNSSSCSDKFVLLTWACCVFASALDVTESFVRSSQWGSVTGALSILLDSVCGTASRRSLSRSANVNVWRVLRRHREVIPDVVMSLIDTSKTSTLPAKYATLIGAAMGVLCRLRSVESPDTADPSIDKLKPNVLAYHTQTILMSKIILPPHSRDALNDFIHRAVTTNDLETVYIPIIEKALLRSPEISVQTVNAVLSSYTGEWSQAVLQRLLASITACAKSSNETVRSGAIEMAKIVLNSQPETHAVHFLFANELLVLPKQGRTASTEHRITLYAILAYVKPSDSVSSELVNILPLLLSKETSEPAATFLRVPLASHLTRLLIDGRPLPKDVSSVIVKECASPKALQRRSFLLVVAECFWLLCDAMEANPSFSIPKPAIVFGEALLPNLESNLKTTVASPMNPSVGPIEGYISLAIVMRRGSPLSIGTSRVLQILSLGSSKTSFLLSDKVYGKLTTTVDELWCLRSLSTTFLQVQGDLKVNASLRLAFGRELLHNAVFSENAETRRVCVTIVRDLNCRAPALVNPVLRETLIEYFQRPLISSPASAEGGGLHPSAVSKGDRLSAALLALVHFPSTYSNNSRRDRLTELFIISHHRSLAPTSRALWVEAVQTSGIDPKDLVVDKKDALISTVLGAAMIPHLKDAAFSAVSSIAFIAPESTVSQLAEQIRRDLSPNRLLELGDFELGVWNTPEGTTYVDILATKKRIPASAKGKDQAIEKWEEELKKTIAAKKANAAPTLSVEDRLLVEDQLRKEAEVRSKVGTIKGEVDRALGFLRSLLKANGKHVQTFVWPICKLLLDGALRSPLLSSAAFDTYMIIGSACSSSLGIYRTLIGISALRSFSVPSVPEDFLVEPLADLALRILYHVHSASANAPLDALSYAYSFPLISRILELGGVGQPEGDVMIEQVTLAMEIVENHVLELADQTYPRYETLEVLLHSIARYPSVSKATASCLVSISHGLNQTVTAAELKLLLQGILAQESFVRSACLQALQPFDLTDIDWCPEMWITCHDDDQPNAQLAYSIWEDNGMDIKDTYGVDLLPLLASGEGYVRASCSRAIASAASNVPSSVPNMLSDLKSLYRDKVKIRGPEFDAYGILIEKGLEQSDPWPAREAISWTLEQLAADVPDEEVVPFLEFLIQEEALGDRHTKVRRGMLGAGVSIVDRRGQAKLQELLAMFEKQLSASYSSTEVADWIGEALVILLGRLAQHLGSEDPRIPVIATRLIDALKTPSEPVQYAVAECLSPLVGPLGDRTSTLVEDLLQTLTTAHKYADRRGAAYGLAGVIRGCGIAGLKEFSIITQLRSAMGDKKNPDTRQGALFAFETMSALLGRLFEPYVIEILPLLLAAYGDPTVDVRQAAQDTSKVIMANMSGYGVKSILPSLLGALEEKQWRTKKGSIELLGSMAFLAPRQLSVSLPTVIPRLTSVLTDSHAQVRSAANSSLKRFGEVINNPEVRSLVPSLLKALVDPERTPTALNSLLKKSFVHYIDSASLALLIPILERGMRERGSETKRNAAQIVGNMASLTDAKDFIPYLPRLIPLMHVVLVDPVPESRATAAKALGTLIERLGEANFPDMISNLVHTLKTDTSSVDRQGAAQGLSEVLSGLGMERMEGLLPEIVTSASSSRSHVREGFMSLLVFLPATFGHKFTPYLSRIIPPILNGLADAEEFVRTASMKAGRMIINNYSNKAIDLLLPELESGMFDSSWRIRHSSITLVGEMLYKVSGISGKSDIEDDSEEANAPVAESSRKALVDVLGKKRRDRILGSLYIIRQDSVHACRQTSIHIWKALVHNTPRTVREILPSLMDQIVALLASLGDEQRETAARTMGELCRKQGERILNDIVPILRAGAESSDSKTREGVCFAISEVLENTTEGQRDGHQDELVNAVRICLLDSSAHVRTAAADAFDSLQEHVGSHAIDRTIPTLLEALRRPGAGSDTALQALREIMTVRASTVFPVLIPTLTTQPISAFNANALASLVTVAGPALTKKLTQVLTALVVAAESEKDEDTKIAVDGAIVALVGSIEDTEGIHSLMMLLLSWAKHESPQRRVSGVLTFAKFCENTNVDFSEYQADWIRQLVSLMDDREATVYEAAWQAFDEFVKSVDKEEMDPLVIPLRRTIEGTGAPGRFVPGFGYGKGVGPMLPIIFAGLTTGSNEQREHAALAIAELVERTDNTALRPYTTQITGPLIRVITQASTLPAGVKSAILIALMKMLERIPTFVKPFFPQLQRTFVKSLTDVSLAVRSRAVSALTVLMRNQPRADPLITELLSSVHSTTDDAVAGSLTSALAGVVTSARKNIGSTNFENLIELVTDSYRESHDEPYYVGIAELFATLSHDAALVRPAFDQYILSATPPHVLTSQILLHTVLSQPEVFFLLKNVPALVKKVQVSIGSDQPSVARLGRETKDILRNQPPWVDDESVQNLF